MREIFACLCFFLILLPTTGQKEKNVWNVCLTSMIDCRYNLNISCMKKPGKECNELVANIPNEMFAKIFDATCLRVKIAGFEPLCQTLQNVGARKDKEIERCLTGSTFNQTCSSSRLDGKCLDHIKDCKKSGKYYCTQMKKYLSLCKQLLTYDGYVRAYEKHCTNRTKHLRCKAITESLKREVELVYPICTKLCEVGHELCISCINEYRNHISDVVTGNISSKLVQKYCVNNTEHEVCNPVKKSQTKKIQKEGSTSGTANFTEAPNANPIDELEEDNIKRILYIIVGVVCVFILIFLGLTIYMCIKNRQNVGKRTDNAESTDSQRTIEVHSHKALFHKAPQGGKSGCESVISLRRLASQPTMDHYATDSLFMQQSASDSTEKSHKRRTRASTTSTEKEKQVERGKQKAATGRKLRSYTREREPQTDVASTAEGKKALNKLEQISRVELENDTNHYTFS